MERGEQVCVECHSKSVQVARGDNDTNGNETELIPGGVEFVESFVKGFFKQKHSIDDMIDTKIPYCVDLRIRG